MIKIDYKIERDEGDDTVIYVPKKIPSELPNVVYIQGPNSSGKSTLLNIIALAFFGLKLSDDELNQELRKKLIDLVDANHQKLTFHIEVDNELMGVKFESEKKNPETPEISLKKFSDGKKRTISSDLLKRQYRLIYDIPINPLDRMKELLNSLREEQKEVGNALERTRNYLRSTIEAIKNAKDPERIDKLKRDEGKFLDIFENEKQKKNNLEKRLNDFELYSLTRLYLETKDKFDDYFERYNSLEKEIKSKERRQTKLNRESYLRQTKLTNIKKEIDDVIDGLKGILPSLLQGDKEQKENYRFWEEANVWNQITLPEIYDSLRRETDNFIDYFDNKELFEEQESRDILEKIELLKLLISLLSDYKESNITLPVVNLPINEFIQNLKEDLAKYEDTDVKLENLRDCKKSLSLLKDLIHEGIGIHKELSKGESAESVDELADWSLRQDLDHLKEKKGEYEAKVDNLTKMIIKKDVVIEEVKKLRSKYIENPDFEIYEIYNEAQLNDKIRDIKTQADASKKKCDRLSHKLEDISEEIERLEKKEPHQYQDYYDVIGEALKKVQNLENLFWGYDRMITEIIRGKYKRGSNKEDRTRYPDEIGKYLGKKIREIRHIEGVYSVQSVDVIDKIVRTQEGKTIHFTDLGTGQGQAAYLSTLLSMSENKKIIALIDEVAMMDESTLEPIKQKLKQLYDERKLLLGIIVQKSDKISVESLI